jgi:hypothetical protein
LKTIEDLLPNLISRTISGGITWAGRPSPHAGYETRLSKYRLSVFEWQDPETDNEGITISILDHEGRQLDYMAADKYASRYAKFHELYQNARRNALGLDKVISEIAAALEEDIPF